MNDSTSTAPPYPLIHSPLALSCLSLALSFLLPASGPHPARLTLPHVFYPSHPCQQRWTLWPTEHSHAFRFYVTAANTALSVPAKLQSQHAKFELRPLDDNGNNYM